MNNANKYSLQHADSLDDKKIWHNLREKPEKWEHVLVQTGIARYPHRICFVNDMGWWMDATKTSFFFPKSCDKPPHKTNDFKVKRWAYIKDLEQL
jgi:hypothetical protein